MLCWERCGRCLNAVDAKSGAPTIAGAGGGCVAGRAAGAAKWARLWKQAWRHGDAGSWHIADLHDVCATTAGGRTGAARPAAGLMAHGARLSRVRWSRIWRSFRRHGADTRNVWHARTVPAAELANIARL